jgi:hypothetical protein
MMTLGGGWVLEADIEGFFRISMWCSAHRHLPIKEQHAP